MELKGLADKIRALAELGLVKENKHRIQTIAMNELEAAMKGRIFLEGKTADGQEIGHYSTEGIYINPDKLSSLIPKGGFKKGGKFEKGDKFQNGKPRLTAYLPGGYKELKDKANFDSNTYNLTLTGTSKDSIKVGKKGDDIVLGFSDEMRRKILQGHEARLGKKIFVLSPEELKLVVEVAKKEIVFLLKQQIKTW
jgi:hypothetical protein